MSINAFVARTASFATSSAFTQPTALGILSDGSEIPDPEIQTESVRGGAQAGIGATIQMTLRVLVPSATNPAYLTELQSRRDSMEPIWVRISGSQGHTTYGPLYVVDAYIKGRTSEPSRRACVIMLSGAEDSASALVTNTQST